MQLSDGIIQQIQHYTGQSFTPVNSKQAFGGSINQAFTVSDGTRDFFVKTNSPQKLDMFEAEALGLEELRKANSIRIPHVIGYGNDRKTAWIILEKIHFGGGNHQSALDAGRQLAQLHSKTAQLFGWQHQNTIGATPQDNTPEHDWIDFWKSRRLGTQLEFAEQKGYRGTVIDICTELTERCDSFIDHKPAASLLHGDLWSGNLSYDNVGRPVIFDPAVYYGDHETDLAMTELFGGFHASFYSAYREVKPIDSGYSVRKRLYNLYHILNHMNLFGGGYEGQAVSIAQGLLAELR